MSTKHLKKRGQSFHFCTRVPSDLAALFPTKIISRSLKTNSKKDAACLVSAYEHRAQTLFLQLRSGMLDKTLQNRLINLFLLQGLDDLHSIADGTLQPYNDIISQHEERRGVILTDDEKQNMRAAIAGKMSAHGVDSLRSHDPFMHTPYVNRTADMLKKRHGIAMTATDKKRLAIGYENVTKKLHDAESGIHRGEWGLYETLRTEAATALSQPYVLFADLLAEYQEWYTASKPTIKSGTLTDMQVECRTLYEILGNRNIAEINTMQSVTDLKTALRKYPLNRKQRFPEKSLSAIFRTERKYAVISLKTANEYIKRLSAVIDYANKSKHLNAANVTTGELFQTETATEEQRQAYDDGDIQRLITAICTQPLWGHEPKPERFWILLIALFHGLRLGNIVALTKRDIVLTDRGTWVMQLRTGKTKSTVRSVAICDALLLLGFLEWVDSLKQERLFLDSSASFSAWYNRNERRADGYNVLGFESKHVTTDAGKCLYSLRHSFAGNVFDVSSDFKITADMMGHSTGRSVTARYTKQTKIDTIKQMVDSMNLQCIDLNLLECRAKELFFQ